MELHLPKGVALMIRNVLNIDPENIEKQINDFFAQARNGLSGAQIMLAEFDARIRSLEAANRELIESHSRLVFLLEGKGNEGHKGFLLPRYGNGNGSDDHPATE